MAYASTLSPRPPGGQLNGFRHSAHSQAVPAGMKKCGHCQEIKDAVEFSADASRGDGLRGWCKACEAEARSKRYKKRKAASDSGHVKRRVSETGYRGHDASLPYAAHPNQQVYENGIGMETAEQIRQDLLQAWTEEAQLHAAAARAPQLAEQLALMRCAAAMSTTHCFPGSHGDLASAPLLAHLTAAQIAQHAAAHVAQQQRSSAFAPVRQQTDTPASIQAAASLAAMELMRQHATNGRLMGMVGKPAPLDIPADRGSPHTSDSEMSAVESLTGMKRGRLGHAATADADLSPAGRPRRGVAAADVPAANNNSGTTGSLKTNSSGCALTAALEGAAAAARRSPPHPLSAAQQPSQLDLMRAPGSQESLDVSVAGPPLSTAQQHALVNRILVSMGHAPLTTSTLAAIMAKTGPKPASPPQSPSLVDPSVRGGSGFAMGQMLLGGPRMSGDGADPSRGFGHDLERVPTQQAQDVSAALAAMFGAEAAAATALAPPRNDSLPHVEPRASGSLDSRGTELLRPIPRAGSVLEVPHHEAPEPGLQHGEGLDGGAGHPHASGQQGNQEPARWASRVSLLLLVLRAVGFAQST